ncbi:inositol monophosphatase family protein [Methylonatrum kenyense]|uniref:inositol monophosphatase family protein n=1 Tax=Methylonatrum kenyense TaxID=455253 RepID=UPI0020C08460|nr:inositol monophosphatase family protein [Methylonatrum kenyense]MCK8515611.1 inositol monophosphatase family protein [Methylonatrum kenyense]
MTVMELSRLRQQVRRVSEEVLLPRFNRVERSFKADGSIVTAADLAMQSGLQDVLRQYWPDIPLLGEEMAPEDQAALLAATGQPVWVLDPLDGTSNFSAGIPFFAVSLALIQGGRPLIGLVYDPVRDECFMAAEGQGAWLNEQSLMPVEETLPLARCTACVDFKRLQPRLARRLAAEPPYSSQRSFGSVALDWCWTAAGRVHLYLHGRQKLWDYAAGCLILSEAGGRSATLSGEPVFRPSLEPRSAVAALSPDLFRQWQGYLAGD